MTQQQLFETQLRKGREGEDAFRIMANKHFDEVVDYTNYKMWRGVQSKGIDFAFKQRHWSDYITCDVKTTMFYQDNNYHQGYVFNIEYEKWCQEEYHNHKKAIHDGWIQDSRANRIYHFERGTMNYVYYDLDEMRSFIYREWDRPNGWLQKLSYIGSRKSDYARLIPVRLTDERFKHLIRKVSIEGYNV